MKHRQLRLNELVKRQLSATIARQINFEDVLVSINAVDVTPDLKNAHVFVSILGAENRAGVIDKLEAHRPVLQAELSRHVVLKYTPPDLKNAHVFVSILGAENRAGVIDKLEAHRPVLQ